jgi:hypothetical protein
MGMKVAKYLALIGSAMLVLSFGAFAKDSNSGSFTVADRVQIGSTALAPGDYKAEWSGPANNVKVIITKHGKEVASTEGQIKNLQQPAPYSAVITKQKGSALRVDEIEFNKRSEALQLGGE